MFLFSFFVDTDAVFIAGMLCAVVATLLDKAPAKEITDIYDKATMLLKED